MRFERHAIAAVFLLACYNPAPPSGAPCGDDLPCPRGQACIAGTCGGDTLDAAGDTAIPPPDDLAIDAVPDVAIDAACAMPTSCQGDQIIGCGTPVDCRWGCNASGTAHCAILQPSNGISFGMVPPNAATLTIPAAGQPWKLDTDTGAITNSNSTLNLPAGATTTLLANYRVYAMLSLVVEANTTLEVVGSHPLVFVAQDSVMLGANSVIDLDGGGCAGDPTCAGPGAGAGATASIPASGCGPGGDGYENQFGGIGEAGGGGGGMSTPGGHGGGDVAMQGPAGMACGSTTNTPLRGGSGGGIGGWQAIGMAIGGRGGGGGGALQITAQNVITAAGTISAAGAGGESGHPTDPMNGGGGGGGGAGGGVLLEAGRVDVGGTVAANGGGGGGNATSANNGDGKLGLRSTACAGGGAPGLYAPGGTGGCAGVAATNTGVGGANMDRGGGGGAAGYVTVRRRDGMTTGVASPTPTTTAATFQ